MRETRGASPAPDDEPRDGEPDIFGSLAHLSRSGGAASARTVWIALGANVLVGVAKSIAAVVTGSASLLAEAAHSWADTGNEVFLLVANRRSHRPPDRAHPLGFGREAYVWSLLAALGLFVAGAAVSVTHGIQELITPEPATDFVVGYVVLALSFLLEGFSFLRSVRQARPTAELFGRDIIEEVMATSDRRQSRSRSSPSAVRARARKRSPLICTPTSGCTLRFRYQPGSRGAPPFDVTTTTSSPSTS
jgi:hypothetical protein